MSGSCWGSGKGVPLLLNLVFTDRFVLDLLRLSPLQGGSVALVLETLRSDKSLDLGSLGVRLLALALGLNFTSNNVLANLFYPSNGLVFTRTGLSIASLLLSFSGRNHPLKGERGAVIFLLTLYPDCKQLLGSSEQAMTEYGRMVEHTSSSLVRLKNRRILVARLGPKRFG